MVISLKKAIEKSGNPVIILSLEIKKQPNTDIGILNAYWNTTKRLIELRANRSACLQFAQMFGRAFGNFKMEEAIGDFKDADLL